jgi:hypothetical protein
MRRSTAAWVLALLVSAGVIDSHVDEETVDGRSLIRIDGVRHDPVGWARGKLQSLEQRCDAPIRLPSDSPVAMAVKRAVSEHSPPDSANPQWHQGLQDGDWLIVELSFERLSPVVALLQHQSSTWRLHPTAIWSGSTEPWSAAARIRDHLSQQAPEAPARLLACFSPLQDFQSPFLLQSRTSQHLH